MILNVQQQFLKGPHSKRWHEASAEEWFLAGLSASLAHLNDTLPYAQDLNQSAANNFRMEGARQLIRVLLNLTDQPETKTYVPNTEQNLVWNENPLRNLCLNQPQ